MMKLQDILDRQTAIRAELLVLEKKAADGEIAEAEEEENQAWSDTLIGEFDELEEQRKPLAARMQKLDSIRFAAQDERKVEKVTPDLVIRNNTDPFDNLDAVRNRLVARSEVKARAFDAIERSNRLGQLTHDYAETATRVVQNGDPGVSRHMLLTGSDEYQEVFRDYIENPEGNAQRAALSLTLANGGYLLPFVLDPSIILTNASSANPWRRISRVVQTTSNTWNGVNSAGVNAAMIGEGAVVADATPTVANIVITPQKANAWIFGSYEVLEDTDFGQQLPVLLADAKDRLEEAQFATGTGTPPQVQGIIPAATIVVTTATTLVVAVGDVYATQQVLPARFRNAPNAAWVANVAQINRFRQLDTAGGSSFWTNLGKGQPATLLGAPIYESTTMDATVAVNALEAIYGDFSQFIICDRVGVSMIYEPLVKDTGTGRPTGQAGWFMFWRFGSQISTTNAFRVMKGK